MQHSHLCVWIDHREAKIFAVGLDFSDEDKVLEPGPHHHIHRKADQVGKGKAAHDEHFLGGVATHLAGARGVLILGPSTAKTELADYLKARHPAIAATIWGVEADDHPTDPQIIAQARKFFHTAEGMRA